MGTLSSLIEEVLRGEDAAPTEPGLQAGQLLGRYQLVRELGRGGFGVVWEARDTDLGRRVALKTLRLAGGEVREKRLLAEAEVAARLSHPNIAAVFDVGRSGRTVFVVQELLSGKTLSEHLAQGALPLRETLRLALGVGRGLAHAHESGVVHRDLSPRNVQVCDDGQVKLLDLGMASTVGRRTLAGGTPEFMAPEQLRGAPEDERTDVYALGVLLYRMLAGVFPVADGAQRGATARGLSLPEVPQLAALVEAMLADEPTERPRDAKEVLAALEAVAATLPSAVAERPAQARVVLPGRRRSLLMGLGAGFAVAIAATGAALLMTGAGRKAGALAAPLVLGAGNSPFCHWTRTAFGDFEPLPAGAVKRNGGFNGQAAVKSAEGRWQWAQTSDWNTLFLPMGDLDGDVFYVWATFYLPTSETKGKAVSMTVFTEPSGPDPAWMNGGLGLILEHTEGVGATYSWGLPAGPKDHVDYKGVLKSPLLDQWRTLRIQGSRSKCWLRAAIDDEPLVVTTGQCGALTGRYIALASATEGYHSTGVLWRTYEVAKGGAGCE
jgi:hypothetical protein